MLERWFGIFCLCTEALVLLMRVSVWCIFVNMVMKFAFIKGREFLYQMTNCHCRGHWGIQLIFHQAKPR